jgi:magnesium chelatase family protein
MNPCRCGHLGDPTRECAKAPRCGEDYQGKLSGPLLDRIDLFVEIQPIAPAELTRVLPGESSATVAARVAAARARQRARYGEGGPACNAEADGAVLRETIMAEAEAIALAEQAAERLRLSTRGFARTLRVARTLADLAGSDRVARLHVAEALTWRSRTVRDVA